MFNLFNKENKENKKLSELSRFGWKKIFSFSELKTDFYEELEENLILADVGGKNSLRIIDSFKKEINNEKIKNKETALLLFKSILKKFFIEKSLQLHPSKLNVVMIIGINGVGKTTLVAKLCHHFSENNDIILGAADTFRAAAVEQLKNWGNRLGVQVINQSSGADPASVVYDTIHSALSKKKNLALIDTAGRLHNKTNLLEQLKKTVGITDKFPKQIHRITLLVLDATQGLSGFEQVKSFGQYIPLDGLILTKCDTEAKGGILLAISEAFKLPIFYYTFGEKPSDIKPFSVDEYINSLV